MLLPSLPLSCPFAAVAVTQAAIDGLYRATGDVVAGKADLKQGAAH